MGSDDCSGVPVEAWADCDVGLIYQVWTERSVEQIMRQAIIVVEVHLQSSIFSPATYVVPEDQTYQRCIRETKPKDQTLPIVVCPCLDDVHELNVATPPGAA